MGSYDIILVPCPKCNTRNSFQTKTGVGLYEDYNIKSAPVTLLSGITRDQIVTCVQCDTRYRCDIRKRIGVFLPPL